MKNILLTTPEQRDSEDPSVELNPKKLEQWINDLPVDNILDTVEQLDRALSAHNEMKILTANRIKLLEVYSNAFSSVFKCYDEMRIAQLKIPSRQKRQLSKDIMWLYIKLSHGYKIVVKNAVNIPQNARQYHEIILATFRSLEFTVTSLIYSYRFGLNIPPLVYLELHQLYAFAEWSDILDKRIKEATGYATQPTIASFYKLSLLFLCLDPSRFEPMKMELIFLALQEFSRHCEMSNKKPTKSNAFSYYIKLNENKIPDFFIIENNVNEDQWVRYFDIENCITEIKSWVEDNKDDNNLLIEYELEILPELVIFLATKKPIPIEKEKSIAKQACVDLVIGFSSVQRILITDSVNLNFEFTKWTVQQETESSCVLTIQLTNMDAALSLGDFVAVVNRNKEKGSISIKRIAFIHGLQHMENEKILLEIDYLPSVGTPFIYMMLGDDGEVNDPNYFNGIYIADYSQNSSEPVIIIDRKHYQDSQIYSINKYGKASIVRPQELLHQTMKYCLFKFDVLQEDGFGSPKLTIKNNAA